MREGARDSLRESCRGTCVGTPSTSKNVCEDCQAFFKRIVRSKKLGLPFYVNEVRISYPGGEFCEPKLCE